MRDGSIIPGGTKMRFLLIGAWNTVFGYAIFFGIYELTSRIFKLEYTAYTTAQIVTWIIAVMSAFLLHKHVTFRSRTKGRAAIFEFFRFTQTYVAMFFFGLAFLPFLVEIVGIRPRIAVLIVTAAGMVINYTGHRLFTFRRDDTSES
jgi:putative flippase GtrA